MIKTTRLPKEFIARTEGPKSKFLGLRQFFEPEVKKSTLDGIDEIQYLEVAPWTSITMHGHEQQWEVWVRFFNKTAYVCLIGEEHELVNNTGVAMNLMAIKGNINYTYDDLAEIFTNLGFTVIHGSLVIDE